MADKPAPWPPDSVAPLSRLYNHTYEHEACERGSNAAAAHHAACFALHKAGYQSAGGRLESTTVADLVHAARAVILHPAAGERYHERLRAALAVYDAQLCTCSDGRCIKTHVKEPKS